MQCFLSRSRVRSYNIILYCVLILEDLVLEVSLHAKRGYME